MVRRRTRSLLTIIGLSVAVAAVVSLVGIAQGFERSFSELYTRRGVDLVVQRSGGSERLNSGLDEKLADGLLRLPGVHSVMGGLMDVISFEQVDLFAVIVNGWRADCPIFDEVKVISGRRLRPGERKAAMLGRVLAANLGRKVGDQIEMYGEPFNVVGIFESFSVYENGSIVLLIGELQRLMDRPGQVTGFLITAEQRDDPQELNRLKERVEQFDPDLTVMPTAEYVGSVQQIRMIRAAAWLTSAIALVIGAIGTLNTMFMSVFERTREIGTLRAIGWRKRRLMRLILSEALGLSVAGAVLGTIGALALTRFLSHLPTTSGLIQGKIAPIVIAQGFGVALLVGLLGAAYPAYWGANLRPIEALRKK